jgi:hypothetical protein
VCNGAEECVTGVCQPMTPLNCDDGDSCTSDSFDEISGCAHDPITSSLEYSANLLTTRLGIIKTGVKFGVKPKPQNSPAKLST